MKSAFSRLSLIALAALCVASGAQAQSSVTLYGAIGLDLISVSKVYSGATSKSMVRLDDNAIVNSRIGFKGSEDLGGGLKGIFDLESSLGPDTGSGGGSAPTFWNRGAFVGLANDMGSIKFGRQWDVADDYMGNYFVFGYYAPFFFNGFGSLSNLYNNAVKITLGDMGGFQAGAFYSLGESATNTWAGNFLQVAATYTAGPFSIGGMYDTMKDPLGTGKKDDTYAIGASYDFGMAKLRLGYGQTDMETTLYKADLIDVGVDVPFSAMTGATVDFVKTSVKNSDNATEYLRFQGYYKLSKRTTLNANLIFLKNSGTASFAWYGTGFPGQKQNIVTAGITHAF